MARRLAPPRKKPSLRGGARKAVGASRGRTRRGGQKGRPRRRGTGGTKRVPAIGYPNDVYQTSVADLPRSRDWQADIIEFHQRFGHPVGKAPLQPSSKVCLLRENLIMEEFGELLRALGYDRPIFMSKVSHAWDLPELADAVGDLIVVLLGTTIAAGVNMHPVWEAIHLSNMAKVGGGEREDGKVLKPAGWIPPDIEGLLEEQAHRYYINKVPSLG